MATQGGTIRWEKPQRARVVYVDDIHYIRCKENLPKDWIAHAIIHSAVHELGHIATKHVPVHIDHSGDYEKCCYLLQEAFMGSGCGYGTDYAGFCEQHTIDIAKRRNNAEVY